MADNLFAITDVHLVGEHPGDPPDDPLCRYPGSTMLIAEFSVRIGSVVLPGWQLWPTKKRAIEVWSPWWDAIRAEAQAQVAAIAGSADISHGMAPDDWDPDEGHEEMARYHAALDAYVVAEEAGAAPASEAEVPMA